MHFQVGVVEWMTKKININGIAGALYVGTWSHYFHPSYINLVLLPTLISGFYLFYKKQEKSWISSFELLVFSIFCVVLQLIMESRIGVVGVLVIMLVSGLYYLHIKQIYFKMALVFVLFIGGSGLIVMQKSVSGFVSDPVRNTWSQLAISYAKDHIWWGAGYHEEATVLTQQEKLMINVIPKIETEAKTYTHNQLLGTMIQFGIPGVVLLLVLVFSIVWYSFKSRSYLLQMLMLLYIFFMMIEEPLYVQEGITRFFVFLAFFIHISDGEKQMKSIDLFKRLSKG
jgi:O-antigen ligase